MLPLLLAVPLLVLAEDKIENQTKFTEHIEQKWISQIMPQALASFYPRSNRNQECTYQGQLYKQHLSNLTLWAVQMLDSSVLAESGIVSGSDYNYGNFDQCVRIRVPQLNLHGKHCFANLRFSPRHFNQSQDHYPFYKPPGPFSSVWNKVQRVKDPRIKYRDNFYWSVCIPSGCDHLDLEESLRDTLTPIFDKNNITVDVTVNDSDCEERDLSVKFTSGTLAYIFTLGGFVLAALIATSMDYLVYSKDDQKPAEGNALLSFSLKKNGSELFKPEKRQEFQFLSGIKVLSMFCIIYGHRMLITYAFPLNNVEDHEERVTEFIETINLSGLVIVNTFLQVTGFLMFSKMLNDMSLKRNISIPFYLFYKWARTTPVYMAIIGVMVYLKPLKVDEPLWRSQGLVRQEACSRNWWSHMLYINNYYDPTSECLLPSWYLAVDMQLFIFCVTVGYIMSKFRKVGYVLLGCLLATSLIIPSMSIYYKGYEPILKLYLNFIRNYRNESDFVEAYIPTHMRAAPYFYGMIDAIIAHKFRDKMYELNLWQMIATIITTTILLMGTLFSSYLFYMPERIPSDIENIVYPLVQRTAWSWGISIIIFFSLNNKNDFVKGILSHKIFIPLNRLTLCALLIHPLVIGYSVIVQRQPNYVQTPLLIWMAAGDVVISYLIGLVFYLLIEAPVGNLLDYTLRKYLLGKK